MEKTLTPAEIADAIINDYDGDVERVRQFYLAAVRLRGSSPLADQVLDRLDRWLIENRWMPMLRPFLERYDAAHPFEEGDDEY